MSGLATRGTRDLLVYGLGQAASQLANFVLVPYYVRVLTPDEYGAVALLMTAQLILSAIALWGTDAALFRSYFDSEDESERSSVVVSSLVLSLSIGIVLAVLAGLAGEWAGRRWLGGIAYAGAATTVAVASIAARVPGQVAISVLRAERRAVTFSVVSLVTLVARLGAMVFWITGAGLGVLGFALGSLTGDLLATIVVVWLVRGRLRTRPSLAEMRTQLAFGTPVMVANIAALLLMGFDRFILRREWGLTDVAVYALGYQIANLMMVVVVNPVQLVWPTVALPLRERSDAPRLYGDALLVLLAGGLGFAVLLSGWAPLVVRVVAPQEVYAPASLVVPFVATANLMVIVQRVMAIGLEIDRTMNRYAVWFWVAAGVNIGLCLVLIPRWGIIGAAIATGLAYLLLPALAVPLTRTASVRIEYPARAVALVTFVSIFALATSATLPVLGSSPVMTGLGTTAALALGATVVAYGAREQLTPVLAVARSLRGRADQAEAS